MKIRTHYNLAACETCGHCPPHSIEEHLRAVRDAVDAAERAGVIVTVRRTRTGVAYDFRASGTEIVEAPTGRDKLGVESSENQPTTQEN